MMYAFTSNPESDGIGSTVQAVKEIHDQHRLDDESYVEIVVWRLPRALPGSRHAYKYRLAYIEDDVCVVRYDNEAGKGDHKHIGPKESDYDFSDLENLFVDFWTSVDDWRRKA